MRLRRLYSACMVLVLAVAGLLLINPNTAFAAPSHSCVWIGGGGDSNFSTTANWSNCGGNAPGNNDAIYFGDLATGDFSPNNDLTGITFYSVGFSNYNFTITGNSFAVSYSISSSGAFTHVITPTVSALTGSNISGYWSHQDGGSLTINDLAVSGTVNVDSLTIRNLGGGSGSTVNFGPDVMIDNSSSSSLTVNVNKDFTDAGGTFIANQIIINNDATFTANSTVTNSGYTTVNSGGTLKGSGSFSGTVVINTGGILAPGNSPGCLTVGTAAISGTYQEELSGADTACTDYDQLIANGSVNITNGTLDLKLTGGFKPTIGQTFRIVDNRGVNPVLGHFRGLAQGDTFSASGYDFRISYIGGTGNDIILTALGKTKAASSASSSDKSAPSAPDTGFAASVTHPIATLAAATLAALVIAIIARRLRPVNT